MSSELINSNNNVYKYLYNISYRLDFTELCALELKYLLGGTTSLHYHYTDDDYPLSRSTFLKSRINILYMEDSIDIIEQKMISDSLMFEEYKIRFIKHDVVEYSERLLSMRKLGYAIEGSFAIKNPRIEFALTKANGKWVFGFYEPNKNEWEIRKTKPFNYSHALEVKLAKSIVNLAVGNNSNLRLVDPCCGIGTVLIEARTLDLNIQGFEINPLIKRNCNTNLEYFGFVGDVKKQDMHTITEHYDIAVLDIPYGQFSFITYEEQVALIKKTKEISDRSVIITMEDMCDTLIQQGLNIIEKVKIEKSNAFSRYITICSST